VGWYPLGRRGVQLLTHIDKLGVQPSFQAVILTDPRANLSCEGSDVVAEVLEDTRDVVYVECLVLGEGDVCGNLYD
jgi:hypothetical protein